MAQNLGDSNSRELIPQGANQFRNLRIEALSTKPDILAATLEAVEAESVEEARKYLEPHIQNGGYSVGAFSSQSERVGRVNVTRPVSKRLRHIGEVLGVFRWAAGC